MLLELMSNGTLAKLPPEYSPVKLPEEEPSVMVLLPHNKYLLGRKNGSWVYGTDSPDNNEQPQNISLYDNEKLALLSENGERVIIPAKVVTAIRNELFLQMPPPGNHVSTVLLLKTFTREHEFFKSNAFNYENEQEFLTHLDSDSELKKLYWTLRFAMARGEIEAVARLKSWLKAGGEKVFNDERNVIKIWFSLLNLPDDESIAEIESLNFPREYLERMMNQSITPVVLFHEDSGFLILGKFGHNGKVNFCTWTYVNSTLWNELNALKKIQVHEIVLAAWAEYDIKQAMNERMRYRQ